MTFYRHFSYVKRKFYLKFAGYFWGICGLLVNILFWYLWKIHGNLFAKRRHKRKLMHFLFKCKHCVKLLYVAIHQLFRPDAHKLETFRSFFIACLFSLFIGPAYFLANFHYSIIFFMVFHAICILCLSNILFHIFIKTMCAP